jgi:hypothetical protein
MSDDKNPTPMNGMLHSVISDNNSQFSLNFNDAMLKKVSDKIAGIKDDISKDLLKTVAPEQNDSCGAETETQETE